MVELVKAGLEDADTIWKMQIEAFADHFKKYQDMDTNPGNQPIEAVIEKLKDTNGHYYLIQKENVNVGAVNIICKEDGEKRISPIFVSKEYQGQKIAQEAIKKVEEIFGSDHWALETAFEEKGNCHLYEKMGYKPTGKMVKVNDKLNLILYYK